MKKTSQLTDLRPYLLPGLIIGLAVLTTLIFLVPKASEVWARRKEIKLKEQKLMRLTTKAAALEGLDENELTTKTDLVVKALPVEKDAPRLMSILRTLAGRRSLIIKALESEPGELATASAEPLVFDLNLSGELVSMAQYVNDLHHFLPLMKLVTVKITQEDDQRELGMTLESLLLSLPEKLGPIEGELPLLTEEEEKLYQQLSTYQTLESNQEELPLVPSGKDNPFSL